MKPEKYIETQKAILDIGRLVRTLDLDAFINRISQAEAIAPIIDPTMYRKADRNLRAIKKMAETLKPFQEAQQEAFEAVLATAMSEHERQQER